MRALARRGAVAAIAAVLGAVAFAPGASAGPVEDVTAVIQDYIGNGGDGDITSCRFTRAQLELTRSYIPADDAYYSDLLLELDREIARWSSGACSTAGGGQSGGGGGQSNSAPGKSGTGGTPGSQQAPSRATIASLKVSSNRRGVKVKLRCPAAAATSCKVTLSGRLAGRKAASAKTSAVARGTSKTVTMKLTAATAQRLKRKGGRLRISARTVGSSQSPVSRTVTVAPRAQHQS